MKVLRSFRALSLALLSLVFAAQLGTHLVWSLNRAEGSPDLAKVLAILPRDSDAILRMRLGAPKRRDPDRESHVVRLPERWQSHDGRQPPHLMVFVDGQRIDFQREAPASPDARQPHSYYRHVGHHRRVLDISCPTTTPCRTAVVVADDTALALAVARDRLGQYPLLLLAVAAAAVVWAVVAFRVTRSAAVAPLLAGQALSLVVAAVWLSGRRYDTGWSGPLLALEILAVAFPLLLVRLPAGFPAFVVRDLVFLHDPTAHPRPLWWRGVSWVMVAGVSLGAFLYMGALGPPQGPLDPDYQMRESLDIALNRAICGASSSTSRAESVRWGVERDPGLRSVPLRQLVERDSGSLERHCRETLQPHLNRENSLALVMATWLRAEPRLSFRGLGLGLQATRIVLLLVFVWVLLANGASLLLAAVLCCSALAVLQNLAQRFYSTYGFMLVLLTLMVALLSYASQRGLPARRLAHIVFAALLGWLFAFSVNMRTSHLPIYVVLVGLYLLLAYRGPAGPGPRRPFRPHLRWAAVTVLVASASAGLFWLVHIRPLEEHQPDGAKRAYSQAGSYHPVAHSLVLALGVPPNPLARREGIDWTDASGLAVARRLDPQIEFLGDGYETILFKYYFGLWAQHPGEMLELYLVKLRMAGRGVAGALSNPSGGWYGAPFFRAVMWPLGWLPGELTPLLYLAVFVLAVAVYLRRGTPLAFTVALMAVIGVLLTLESTLIYPRFQIFYDCPHMLIALTVAALVWQLLLDGARWTLQAVTGGGAGPGRWRLDLASWRRAAPRRGSAVLLLLATAATAATIWASIRRLPGEGRVDEDRAENAVLDRLGALGYVDTVDEAKPRSADGVTVLDRALASPGLDLFAPIGGMEGYLMTLDGKTVHTWTAPASWAPKGWYHLELLPDGGLLAVTYKAKPDALLRLDFDSNLVWSSRLDQHHDVALTERGDIYTLTQAQRSVRYGGDEETILDNSITLLSSSGVLRSQVSIFDLLGRAQAKRLEDRLGRLARGEGTSDLLHTNTIEILRRTKGPVKRGDLLLCSFGLGLLFVVDEAAGEVVWSLGLEDVGEDGQPLVGMAHMPTQLDNGNFLVFVNGISRRYSSVVEVDPATKRIAWQYVADPPESFFSKTRGAAQPLPNGNVLITESDNGRAFEITREGRIVWEYVMPRDEPDGERKAVYRMMRITPALARRLALPTE